MQDYDIEIPQFVNDIIEEQTFFIALDKPLATLNGKDTLERR